MPQRFDLSYVGADNDRHKPIMIHRVIFGSIERFIGILIEHYGGKFPVWLSPVQVKVLSVSEKSREYANSIYERMKAAGIRCEVDNRDEKIGYKIREAQLQKAPYMLVIGEKEVENGNLTVRSRDKGDLGAMDVQAFIDQVLKQTAERQD
jgi:threonyl-tRNA synthetase